LFISILPIGKGYCPLEAVTAEFGHFSKCLLYHEKDGIAIVYGDFLPAPKGDKR
jgi:hypothetical protein